VGCGRVKGRNGMAVRNLDGDCSVPRVLGRLNALIVGEGEE
jgi:hypothetical protein